MDTSKEWNGKISKQDPEIPVEYKNTRTIGEKIHTDLEKSGIREDVGKQKHVYSDNCEGEGSISLPFVIFYFYYNTNRTNNE